MKTLRNTMPPSQTRRAAAAAAAVTATRDYRPDLARTAPGGVQANAGQIGQGALPQAGASQQASDGFVGRVIKVGPAKVPSRPLTINRH